MHTWPDNINFHPIPFQNKIQSQTKLLEKVFPVMSTFLRNKTISKTTPLVCGKKSPFPSSMLFPTNDQGSGFLLNRQQHCFQGKGEKEEPGTATCMMSRKMLLKYTIFSTVLSRIVADIPSYQFVYFQLEHC